MGGGSAHHILFLLPRMQNEKGEALYYNVIMKNGKIQYALKAIGEIYQQRKQPSDMMTAPVTLIGATGAFLYAAYTGQKRP